MSDKIDRRVQKTRALLRDALLELALETDYEKIGIKDITERANVGRSTFYAHYERKDDLFLEGIDTLVSHLLGEPGNADTPSDSRKKTGFRFSLEIFKHSFQHRELIRVITGKRSGRLVQERMQQGMLKIVQKELSDIDAAGDTATINADFRTQFIIGAFTSVLYWWLENDTPMSPEKVNTIFGEWVTSGVWSGLSEKT